MIWKNASYWKDAFESVTDRQKLDTVAKLHLETGHDCLAIVFISLEAMLRSYIIESSSLFESTALLKITLTNKYWESREMITSFVNFDIWRSILLRYTN